MLCVFLDMAARHPLLGGVLLAVPGGRVRLGTVHHACTVVSPAIDPGHLVPWVDLEASLLVGRRVEMPGLLQRKDRKLLVIQRAHELDIVAAQYIIAWLEASPLGERSPILAVVDDMTDHVPYWLDCRLAFRLQWNEDDEPELTNLPLFTDTAAHRGRLYSGAETSDDLLRSVAIAAAARGLNDPRYDLMTAAAAHTRAACLNRLPNREDLEWAIRWVLDSRIRWKQPVPSQNPPLVEESLPSSVPRAASFTATTVQDTADASRQPAVPTSAASGAGAAPRQPAHTVSPSGGLSTSSALDNRRDGKHTVSPAGQLAGESGQFAPVAPVSEAEVPTAEQEHVLRPRARVSTAAGRATGRYGPALPGTSGHWGRRQVRSSGQVRIDLAATLQAAAPWQRLRAIVGRQESRRILVYPQDLKYRRRERRPGRTYFILLDASASMWGRHLARAKSIALQLVELAYRKRSRISVIAVRGTEPELMVPPGRCYDQAYTTIRSLESGGSTPLVPALSLALSWLIHSDPDENVEIYILTDGRGTTQRGGDPFSADDVGTIGQALVTVGALVTVIGIASPGQDRAARRLAQALRGSYQSVR